jgi:Htaa
VKGLGNFEFPITGGTISPSGTTGTVQSAGGVELEQKIQTGATEFLETKITLSGFYVDLAAKTITVEVSAVSNTSPELNLGNLGRSSIADLTVAGVVSDSVTRTVTLQGASAKLQPISAKVLNAFVEVYEGYEAKGGKPNVSPEKINSGDPLGSFSFTAQTQ